MSEPPDYEPLPPAAPLPRSVRWFAPWTWSRRARWLLLGWLLAVYIEAPVPIMVMTNWGRLKVPEAFAWAFLPWTPVMAAWLYLPGVAQFYAVQTYFCSVVLTALFGGPSDA